MSATPISLCMGDRLVFDQLFRSYYAPLCHFTENIIGSKEDAEDLVEELFFTLWKKGRVFADSSHARAYLYRATRNTSLNFIKHGKAVANTYDLLRVDIGESEQDYLAEMIRAEVWGEIYRAINDLPSQCCKVITLSFIDGKTNNEIADELGLSVQTVKNTKTRGLLALRDALPRHLLTLLILNSIF
jgi:RNA polymerase sigma-70 factor (family 1)